MITDLKFFPTLRKQIGDARGHAAQLRASAEARKRQRDELRAAPAAKVDLKAAVQRYMADEANDFAVYLGKKIQPLIVQPHKLGNREMVARCLSPFNAAVPDGSLPSAQTMDIALTGLCSTLVLQGFLNAIDGLAFEEGPPLKERTAQLAKLDAEIKQLEDQLAELVETARGAGILLEA